MADQEGRKPGQTNAGRSRGIRRRAAVVAPPACEQIAGLQEGERVGRFLVVRDQDGILHAVAAGAVTVMREVDDGTMLLMSGGRMLSVPRTLRTVLAWLDGRP